MGTVKSSHDWQPPPQPMGNLSSGTPVDYHMVASEVALIQTADCSCYPKVHVAIDIDDLYAMLGEQFTKGYRMLYFSRMPGHLTKRDMAMDLFFEVPTLAPKEHYMYQIALVPVHVEYMHQGIIFFPEIQCDWMTVLQGNLSQGWRLIDIYIDTPMVEQLRIPLKRRRHFCQPTDMDALWIFERPASVADNPRPLYEGSIVEQGVVVRQSNLGVESSPDWLPVIQDMGMRGWELACVVESHKVVPSSTVEIKSLLFFQRPIINN